MTPASRTAEPPLPPLTGGEIARTTLSIVVRLLAGFFLANQVSPFFYQQF